MGTYRNDSLTYIILSKTSCQKMQLSVILSRAAFQICINIWSWSYFNSLFDIIEICYLCFWTYSMWIIHNNNCWQGAIHWPKLSFISSGNCFKLQDSSLTRHILPFRSWRGSFGLKALKRKYLVLAKVLLPLSTQTLAYWGLSCR